MDRDAKQVPLIELLRAVPVDACHNYTDQDGLRASHHIPVGRYCHEAAVEIRRLQISLNIAYQFEAEAEWLRDDMKSARNDALEEAAKKADDEKWAWIETGAKMATEKIAAAIRALKTEQKP